MRKKIYFIASFLFLIIFTLRADLVQAEEYHNKSFNYIIKNGQVTITKYKGNEKTVKIPDKLGKYKVTCIGKNAFCGCKKITRVSLPSELNQLGAHTFTGCKSLKDISLPKDMEIIDCSAFSDCESLRSINLPEKISSLGGGAFYNCKELQNVTLPSGLKEIGSYTFKGCKSLKEISLPDNIETIGSCAFMDCKSLEEISLPENLETIWSEAFKDCTGCIRIDLPKHLKSIDRDVFYGCSNLCDITLPEGLESLGSRTFYGCSKIESMKLPSSFKGFKDYFDDNWDSFEMHSFAECTSLKEIQIDDKNPVFCSEKGVLYSKDKTMLYCVPSYYQGEYEIPSTVNKIMQGAFASQKMLNEVSIPDTVTYLGPMAFYKAVSVEKVNLTGKIEKIYDRTFTGSGIKILDIPEGISTIATYVFNGCSKLEKVSLPKSLNDLWEEERDSPFSECKSLKEIIVAKGSKLYHSESGMLFDQKTLLCYPALKKGASFTMPKNIGIGPGAFDSCKYLRKVIIPEGTKYIFAPFYKCENLKVCFPRSIESFPSPEHSGDFALFRDCKKCYAMVYKNSKMHKYCLRDKIPYKITRGQ